MGPGDQSQVLVPSPARISSSGTQLVLEIPSQLWEKRHSALNHTQQTMAKKQRATLFVFAFGILGAIHRIGQFRHAVRTVISLLTPLYTERRAKVDKSP